MSKMTLREHRLRLHSAGSLAYTHEIDLNISRLIKTLVPHLRAAGYKKVSPTRNADCLSRVIKMLFEAQDSRPMFHVEGTELPLCWNSPKDWNKDYIKYEWGHLLSRNQNTNNAHRLENLALYSARCNQHVQTSLNIHELMVYGGIIAQRISLVLTNRRRLFVSNEWVTTLKELQ